MAYNILTNDLLLVTIMFSDHSQNNSVLFKQK